MAGSDQHSAVRRVGVVGAGTMGAGIAQLACLGGYETLIQDPDPAALEAGAERVVESLGKGVRRELWSAEEAEAAGDRLTAVPDLAGLAGCDLVIEAAPEDLELKRSLFASLAALIEPRAILATNTSSLSVTDIAAETPHPERVVGMHFFNPPALMELVEVVAAAESSPRALEATTEVGRRMGRTPIRAKDSPGFVANRLARPYPLESLRMLSQGIADAPRIDRALRLGGGFRMGPFELIDLIGLDVNLSVARSFFAQGGEPERWRPSEIQERMVGEGLRGRKSGRGFYAYGDGPHREEDPDLGIAAPTLDPDVLAKIDPVAPQVVPRLVAQIANEAAFALEEEVGSPEDMDTAMRLGFNWPLGPIEFTDLIGARRAVELLEELRAEWGEAYVAAPGLRAAAERAGTGAPSASRQPSTRPPATGPRRRRCRQPTPNRRRRAAD
jgi:3-hydroxybutyryl-CoA dehydrogenase